MRCACPELNTIYYTVRSGPRTGDVLCGPCVTVAGGSPILRDGSPQNPRRFPSRYPLLVLLQLAGLR